MAELFLWHHPSKSMCYLTLENGNMWPPGNMPASFLPGCSSTLISLPTWHGNAGVRRPQVAESIQVVLYYASIMKQTSSGKSGARCWVGALPANELLPGGVASKESNVIQLMDVGNELHSDPAPGEGQDFCVVLPQTQAHPNPLISGSSFIGGLSSAHGYLRASHQYNFYFYFYLVSYVLCAICIFPNFLFTQ